MEGSNLPTLLAITRSSENGECFCSTTQLSNLMNLSQQSASRKLIELEKRGLIERVVTPKGIKVIITQEGRKELEKAFFDLKKALGAKNYLKLEGIVASGLGEGKYYTGQEEYKKQFRQKLGLSIFVGTLNLKVNYLEAKEFLSTLPSVKIDGFATKERSFGAATAFKAKLNGEKVAVIVPDRTKHEQELIEVIAENNLRKKLGLKDGRKVVLTN